VDSLNTRGAFILLSILMLSYIGRVIVLLLFKLAWCGTPVP